MSTSLRVMTWNIENLFRPEASAATAADPYERKLRLIGDTVDALAPDIIAFQEIGSEDAFDDLGDALGSAFVHRRLSRAPDGRGIRVGIIGRYPIIDDEDIVDFPDGPALRIETLNGDGDRVPMTRMGRGALRVRVAFGGSSVDVMTAHLKSKLLSFPSRHGGRFQPRDEWERTQVAGIALMQRSAESVTLRLRANQLLVGNGATPLIVLGDFNDVPHSATAQIINGPPGSEIGTGGFHPPDKGDDARLFNLAPLIAEQARYSRVFKGRRELLDQIFVSEGMLPRGTDGRRRLPVEVTSHVSLGDGLASIDEDPRRRRRDAVPDHAPVTATFMI